jgi:hypothetical protein
LEPTPNKVEKLEGKGAACKAGQLFPLRGVQIINDPGERKRAGYTRIVED